MTVRNSRLRLSFGYLPVAALCACAVLFEQAFPASLLCIVLHEMGHIAVLLHFGAQSVEIKLGLMSADIIDKEKTLRGEMQEMIIALAGPAVNLVCIPIFLIADAYSENVFFKDCAMISAALCVFNLLPFGETDGSTALRIIISRKLGADGADKVLFIAGIVIIIPAVIASIFILVHTRRNFTPLLASVCILYSLLEDKM